MIRKNTNGDISDEEFEQILNSFVDDYDDIIISYIMLEVIAYYIANSYYKVLCIMVSFLQYYNSAKDLINLFGEDYVQVNTKFYKLHKYVVLIVN